MKSVIVEKQNHPNSLTAGIQEAIDSLPATGGIVHIPAGEYLIYRCIKLKSNVSIQGEGRSTIITRPPEKFLDVVEDIAKNNHSFRVSNATGVVLGHEYCIKSSDEGGWHCKHGTVSSIKTNIKNNLLNIYPNPNNGNFTIDFTSKGNYPITISLFDVTGKIIYQQNMQHNNKSLIQIADDVIAAGIYNLQISSTNDVWNKKVMITR